MATVDYEQAESATEAADISQAHRMRADLKRAREAATSFRKQQEIAAMKAQAAERVAEACAAALQVLEPDSPDANGDTYSVVNGPSMSEEGY